MLKKTSNLIKIWFQNLKRHFAKEYIKMANKHLKRYFTLHHSVQFSSVAQSCLTICDPMNHSMPGLSVHHQLPEFTQTHVHLSRTSSHLILCCPLLLLPPIPPSIRVFSNESTLRMRWPKYWSFSLSISLSNEGLVSFIDYMSLGQYKLKQ